MRRLLVFAFLFLIYKFSFSQPQWNIKALDTEPIYSIGYLNGDTVLLYGELGKTFLTTNLGLTWTTKSNPISHIYKASNLDYKNAIAVGVNSNIGYIANSSNQGNNWQSQFVPGPIGDHSAFLSLSIVNSNIAFTGGYDFNFSTGEYGGTIFKTVNGGINWNLIYYALKTDFTDMFFKNENEGVALAYDGFFKTTNGGVNFIQYSGAPGYAITFTDPYKDTIYVSGTLGRIARTIDNGLNWSLYTMNSRVRINRIFSVNSKIVYACCDSGKVYKTTNAGENWADLSLEKNWSLKDVKFIDENTGFIVGDSGRVLKTTTGGPVFISDQNLTIPGNYFLFQNYPNPFNPNTFIGYQLRSSGYISLNLYNINGKLVKNLEAGFKHEGNYEVNFNSENLSSGIYYYGLFVNDKLIDTKKAVLIK